MYGAAAVWQTRCQHITNRNIYNTSSQLSTYLPILIINNPGILQADAVRCRSKSTPSLTHGAAAVWQPRRQHITNSNIYLFSAIHIYPHPHPQQSWPHSRWFDLMQSIQVISGSSHSTRQTTSSHTMSSSIIFFPNTSVYSVLSRVVAPIFSPPSPSGYESYIIPGNGFVLFVTKTEGGGKG